MKRSGFVGKSPFQWLQGELWDTNGIDSSERLINTMYIDVKLSLVPERVSRTLK
jgi:hypothetical protein